MRSIGFSTGALAKDDFRRGVEMSCLQKFAAIELSALRRRELDDLMAWVCGADLSKFDYVSIHAPGDYASEDEPAIVEMLRPAIHRGFRLVVHPDAIHDADLWQSFGPMLCIENMDKRKPIGRTVEELSRVFRQFPDASFCFDIGHAKQIDPTMYEARRILREFRGRLAHLHVSDVNSRSEHERLNWAAIESFAGVADVVPADAPIILETPIGGQQDAWRDVLEAEVLSTKEAFERHELIRLVPKGLQDSGLARKVVSELPRCERAFLLLQLVEKLSRAEIGRAMGISADAAAAIEARVFQRLNAALESGVAVGA